MELTEKQMELMDLHRQGKLSGNELAGFEARLERDENYAREYELFLATIALQKTAAREQEREKLKDIEDRLKAETESEKPHRKRRKRGGLLTLAAAIMLLVTFVGYELGRSPGNSPADLFAEYYQAYPNLYTSKGAGQTSDPMIPAMLLYDAGDYQQALEGFGQLPDSLQNRDLTRIYRGISYAESGDLARAEEDLKILAEDADSKLSGVAAWYLGLFYLKAGRLENSRAQLGRAGALDPSHRSKAEALLRAMEGL